MGWKTSVEKRFRDLVERIELLEMVQEPEHYTSKGPIELKSEAEVIIAPTFVEEKKETRVRELSDWQRLVKLYGTLGAKQFYNKDDKKATIDLYKAESRDKDEVVEPEKPKARAVTCKSMYSKNRGLLED